MSFSFGSLIADAAPVVSLVDSLLTQNGGSDILSAIEALPSTLQAAATVAPTTNPITSGVGPQTAMVKNLSKHMPTVSATEWNTLTSKIGQAVAEAGTAYAASNPNASQADVTSYLLSTAGEAAVAGLVAQVFANQGLVVPATAAHTISTMTAIGIEMYVADLGQQAIAVGAAA